MEFESMTKEELIKYINDMKSQMDNVIVFWGGRREFHQTLKDVAGNEQGEYTKEEQENASLILESDGAFDELIDMIRDSFERGGINYVISEKVSTLMEETAERQRKA